MQVVCEHPVIILHPRIKELIATYKHIVFRGEHKKIWKSRHLDDIDLSPYFVKRNGITHEDLSECYIIDESTGEIYPMYLEVPCGHCDICKNAKINSFVTRCRYESQMYDSLPWFVTLTYDNDHVRLPEFSEVLCKDVRTGLSYKKTVPVGGVNVRDCQLFLKRLRRNIERSSLFNFNFRYVLVAEYGKTTHRPHYHAILFGINTYTPQEHLAFVDLLRKSWQNGFIQHRLMDLTNDDKGIYYTCKYLKKDCDVPEGCAPTFMLSSRGHGGIGSGFIDKIASDLRKSLNIDFKFRDKWTSKVTKLQFSRYLLDRVFPSFYRSVSSVFRRSVQLIVTYGRSLLGSCRENLDYEKLHCYDKYFFTGFDTCKPMDWFRKRVQTEISLMNATIIFHKFFVSLEQCELAQQLDLLRKRFFAKLFAFQYPIDIKLKAYQCRQILNYSSIYSVL